MQRALLGVITLSATGTAAELASERHWTSAVQLIPWAALAVLLAGVVNVYHRGANRWSRVAAVLVVATSAVGVVEHILENLQAGPLDQKYAYTWNGMSATRHLWLAATGGVGPAPPLAAAALAQLGLLLLVAAWQRKPGPAGE